MLDDLIHPEHLEAPVGPTACNRGLSCFRAARVAIAAGEEHRAAGAVRDLPRAGEREFGVWPAEVRLAHKPKRNFMKRLDEF